MVNLPRVYHRVKTALACRAAGNHLERRGGECVTRCPRGELLDDILANVVIPYKRSNAIDQSKEQERKYALIRPAGFQIIGKGMNRARQLRGHDIASANHFLIVLLVRDRGG